jgi:hypothetical protein
VVAGLISRARQADSPASADQRAEATRLAEVRAVLAEFDWEFVDRQLALERIERIVTAGQS